MFHNAPFRERPTRDRVMRRCKFIALLGGVLLAGGALLATASFAQGIGRWIISTPMPSSRTEVAVAEVGGKIYVVGGFGGERELEIYDPAADRWSRGASIPRALHHAAAVGLKDKLYVVGGFVEGWTPTDEVHEYDPASDRWRRLPALPTPRGALAAAVLGGKIHAVGGIGWRGRNTPAHEVYDPAANRWTALAYVPTARDHLAAAAIDGASTRWVDASTATIRAICRRTRRMTPQPIAGSNERRCPRRAAASRRWCLRGGCSCSGARRRRAPSTKCKPTMAGAMAGAIMRVCRRPATVLAQRRSRAGFTSSRAGRRPVTRFRPPMRFSCRDAGQHLCWASKAILIARTSRPPILRRGWVYRT